MKTIKKSITISAPKAQVWNILFQNQNNQAWLSEFSEGSRAETDWQEGSKAVFTDNSGNGIAGFVKTSQPGEYLVLEYNGMIYNGKEDFESKDAQSVKGSHETYKLSEKGNLTQLDIESDMAEEHFDSMAAAWDKALQKIKELSEANTVTAGS